MQIESTTSKPMSPGRTLREWRSCSLHVIQQASGSMHKGGYLFDITFEQPKVLGLVS